LKIKDIQSLETHFLRYRKVIEHGTQHATCKSYFEAYWLTWSSHATRLPPDLNEWHPQAFSSALFLSIRAGVDACQSDSQSTTSFGQVVNDPQPVSVADRSENKLKHARSGDTIAPSVADHSCISCEAQAQHFAQNVTTAGGVNVTISISVND
jgi:hypothetical protein